MRDVLVKTLEDIREADTPDELRGIAFEKVFELRARGGVAAAPVEGRPTPPLAMEDGGGDSGGATGLAAVASRIGVDVATVEEVYALGSDGDLDLIIPAGKISPRVASGTKDLALLVAGGRQAAGIEEFTASDVIRDVCADFKRLDGGNFAKTVRAMENEFRVRKDSDRKFSVKLSRPGWDHYTSLVKRLGGEE